MKHKVITLLVGLLFVGAFSSVYGQTALQLPAGAESQQGGATGDPVRQLNLTPEQREQIRTIREQNKEERAAINERVGVANRALQEALDAENPDEALVEQRLRDVTVAQAAAVRIRTLTEIRIRRVLTVEQRLTLRLLQKQARENRRERLLAAPDERQQRQEERRRVMQNQRNGLGPLIPRRENQRRPRL